MRIKSICFLQLIKKVSDLFLSQSLALLETSNFCFPNHKRDYKISLYVLGWLFYGPIFCSLRFSHNIHKTIFCVCFIFLFLALVSFFSSFQFLLVLGSQWIPYPLIKLQVKPFSKNMVKTIISLSKVYLHMYLLVHTTTTCT